MNQQPLDLAKRSESQPPLEPYTPAWIGAAVVRLLALIPGELQAFKVEQGAGGLWRLTCVRRRGSPLTTLDQDLGTALRLALAELEPGAERCTCGHLRSEHGHLAICKLCGCRDFCRSEQQGEPLTVRP